MSEVFSFLWSAAAFVIAIGVLVSFHEYGHFWVARKLGVKVLRYSIGFGRPLWRKTGSDGVEYVIAAIPLGGYVKMLDEREGNVAPEDVGQAFNRKSVWVRILIVLAGPAANFLLAVVLYWLVFMIGMPGLKPLIAEPSAGSLAASIGLKSGDEIRSVKGEGTPTFQVLRAELIERALDSSAVELEVVSADGSSRRVSMPLQGARIDPQYLFEDLGLRPYQPEIPAVVAEVVAGSAAEAAGFLAGDEMLAFDGQPIESWSHWVTWIRAHPGEATEVEYLRDGARSTRTLIVGTHFEGESTVGRIGVRVQVPPGLWENLRTEQRLDVLAAVPAAFVQTLRMSGLTLKLLWRMVLGDVSVRNVSGPIQIAQVAGYTASIGLVSFLSFVAIVSVSLFVLNLLPVPVLDGGHLLYYLVEAVKGSPLPERAQVLGQQVGVVMIVALMGLAIYNDILSLIR